MAKKAPRRQPAAGMKRAPGAGRGGFSSLEKDAEEGFEPLFVRLIWRLGLASRRDLNGLSHRVEALERRVRSTARLKVVPSKPPPARGSSDNSAA